MQGGLEWQVYSILVGRISPRAVVILLGAASRIRSYQNCADTYYKLSLRTRDLLAFASWAASAASHTFSSRS
jgi:hypothetical protein